jgi:hypothetical protein
VKDWRERLLEPFATMLATQKVSGDAVREETRAALGDLRNAHLLVVGIAGAFMLRTNGKLAPFDSDRDARGALFAALIMGLGLCEQAIEEGRYLQAHALLRQELELLARLVAIRTGTGRAGRTANVAGLETSLKRLYGSLSDAAHLTRSDLVREATRYSVETPDDPGSVSGTRYFPVIDRDVARRSFALHLYILIHAIAEISGDIAVAHPEARITEEEAGVLDLAIRVMMREGMLERDDKEDEVRSR